MPNAYISLTTIKASGGLDIASTAYDDRLVALTEAVSREIDRYTDRYFYFLQAENREFSGNGKNFLLVPDLIAIPGSGLKEDTNLDGTFETVWASADFLYAPYNAAPTSTYDAAKPYTKLEINLRSDGTQDEFLKGQRNYQITGTWGYSRMLVDVVGDLSASINATATTLTLTSAGTISRGEMLYIDSEQMYVVGTGTGANLTVERARNNSTGATHTATANVQIVVYPSPVREAAFIQTARLWKRRDSGFAAQVGMSDLGQMTVITQLDHDVKALLHSYVRYSVG